MYLYVVESGLFLPTSRTEPVSHQPSSAHLASGACFVFCFSFCKDIARKVNDKGKVLRELKCVAMVTSFAVNKDALWGTPWLEVALSCRSVGGGPSWAGGLLGGDPQASYCRKVSCGSRLGAGGILSLQVLVDGQR